MRSLRSRFGRARQEVRTDYRVVQPITNQLPGRSQLERGFEAKLAYIGHALMENATAYWSTSS